MHKPASLVCPTLLLLSREPKAFLRLPRETGIVKFYSQWDWGRTVHGHCFVNSGMWEIDPEATPQSHSRQPTAELVLEREADWIEVKGMNFRATWSCVLITAVLLPSYKAQGKFFQILKGHVQHPWYVLKMKCLPQALFWKLVAPLGSESGFQS